MSLQSPYAITLTPAGGSPISLVGAGGWLSQLPSFEAEQDLFESDGILRADAFFRPLGNVVVSISFTVEEDLADLAAALDAFAVAATGSLLQISGALAIGATVFQNAVVTAITPDLPGGPAATLARAFLVQTTLPL